MQVIEEMMALAVIDANIAPYLPGSDTDLALQYIKARLQGTSLDPDGQAVGFVYPHHLKMNGPDWGPAPLHHEPRHGTVPVYLANQCMSCMGEAYGLNTK